MNKGFWIAPVVALALLGGCTAVSPVSETEAAHPRPSRSLTTGEMAVPGNVAKLGRLYQNVPARQLDLAALDQKDGVTDGGCLKYWISQDQVPVAGEGFYYESVRVCFRQLAADRGVYAAIRMKDGFADQRVENVGDPLDWEARAEYFVGYEPEAGAAKLYLPELDIEVSVPMGEDLMNGNKLRPDMVYVNGAALRKQDALYIKVSQAMHDFLHYAQPRY